MIRRIVSISVIAVMLLISVPVRRTYAQSGGDFTYTGEFDLDAFLMEFSTAPYDNRSSKSPEKERAAALYIAEKFLALGLLTYLHRTAEDSEQYLQSFSYASQSIYSQNVIAVKPAAGETDESVIIAAHYDNVYDYEIVNPYNHLSRITQSNGAYDNASGVAVMMSVAHRLKDVQLPFNVIFIGFGAEEAGLFGSRHYYNGMSDRAKQNTLLMVNLDSIAAGDYLYMFTKDWPLKHDTFLRDRAKALNVPLKSFPADKKYSMDIFNERFYSHIGYYSDNYFFVHGNINTAFFLTYNLHSVQKAGAVESDRYDDIMHTANDNYTRLTELYGGTYLLHMQYVSELITDSLTADGFAAAMRLSRQNAPNFDLIMDVRFLTVLSYLSCFAVAVIAYFYYKKLQRAASAKMEEYLQDPANKEKMENMYQNLQNIFKESSQNIFTYHPSTYKPKKGEKDFSVFGKDFEDKDEGYSPKKEQDDDNPDDSDKNKPGPDDKLDLK